MYYVYLIKSTSFIGKTYTGITRNIRARLEMHNRGGSPHTAKYGPWELVLYIAFVDDENARLFEKYLKVGSGKAFANRHFW